VLRDAVLLTVPQRHPQLVRRLYPLRRQRRLVLRPRALVLAQRFPYRRIAPSFAPPAPASCRAAFRYCIAFSGFSPCARTAARFNASIDRLLSFRSSATTSSIVDRSNFASS